MVEFIKLGDAWFRSDQISAILPSAGVEKGSRIYLRGSGNSPLTALESPDQIMDVLAGAPVPTGGF